MADTNTTYTIISSNGEPVFIVPENVIDSNQCSIALIGKGIADYGEAQSTNFVHIMENFASINPPAKPMKGQLWFKIDTDSQGVPLSTHSLMMCGSVTGDVGVWEKLAQVHVGSIAPNLPGSGDMWYDEENHQFKVYDSILSTWVVIGPQDYLHDQPITGGTITPKNMINPRTTTYTLPSDLFSIDITSKEEADAGFIGVGVVYLMDITVIAKESYETPTALDDPPRSYASLIKLAVQAYKNSDSTINLKIMGEPNYETIGYSGDVSKWGVIARLQGNTIGVACTATTKLNSHVSWMLNFNLKRT